MGRVGDTGCVSYSDVSAKNQRSCVEVKERNVGKGRV